MANKHTAASDAEFLKQMEADGLPPDYYTVRAKPGTIEAIFGELPYSTATDLRQAAMDAVNCTGRDLFDPNHAFNIRQRREAAVAAGHLNADFDGDDPIPSPFRGVTLARCEFKGEPYRLTLDVGKPLLIFYRGESAELDKRFSSNIRSIVVRKRRSALEELMIGICQQHLCGKVEQSVIDAMSKHFIDVPPMWEGGITRHLLPPAEAKRRVPIVDDISINFLDVYVGPSRGGVGGHVDPGVGDIHINLKDYTVRPLRVEHRFKPLAELRKDK
jgi:hypothetical protein